MSEQPEEGDVGVESTGGGRVQETENAVQESLPEVTGNDESRRGFILVGKVARRQAHSTPNDRMVLVAFYSGMLLLLATAGLDLAMCLDVLSVVVALFPTALLLFATALPTTILGYVRMRRVDDERGRRRVMAAAVALLLSPLLLVAGAKLVPVIQPIVIGDVTKPRAARPGGPVILTVPDQYKTLNEAFSEACPGDTVQIRAGVYETPMGNTFLHLPAGVSLAGEGRDLVCLRSDALNCPVLQIRNCSFGRVSGITFEHRNRRKANGRPCEGIKIVSSSIEITDCCVRSANGSGISITGTGMPRIENCKIAGNGECGIMISKANAIIRGNECKENAQSGIYFMNGAGGTAEENVAKSNKVDGITVFHKGTEPKIIRNICFGNARHGILFAKEAGGVAEMNELEQNVGWGIAVCDPGTSPDIKHNTFGDNKSGTVGFSEDQHYNSDRQADSLFLPRAYAWFSVAVIGKATVFP